MGIGIYIGNSVGKCKLPYWTPPFKSDALFGLDGTIITVGADYYFKDKTGHSRDFLITGKDWDDSTVRLFDNVTVVAKGFFYKSNATISAPAGDAVLIAADINNYLYAGDGTPNQIPVVSLFQDVDYEHKIFCKHVAQTVTAEGVESYEPRVLEMVMYTNIKSGADLTTCQTYFGVPAEVTSNVKWVDAVNGSDSAPNDGTKAKPYATIGKAYSVATDGFTVYVKSSTYTISSTLSPTTSHNTIGLGLVNITTASDIYLITATTAGKTNTYKHLTLDAADVGGVLQYYAAGTAQSFTSCGLKNNNAASKYLLYSILPLTLTNCVLYSKTYRSGYMSGFTATGCLFNCDTGFNTFQAVVDGTYTFTYNKIIYAHIFWTTSDAFLAVAGSIKASIDFEYNTILGGDAENLIYLSSTGDQDGYYFKFKYNIITGGTKVFRGYMIYSEGYKNGLFQIEYNNINADSALEWFYLANPKTGSYFRSNLVIVNSGTICTWNHSLAGQANAVVQNRYNVCGIKVDTSAKGIGVGEELTSDSDYGFEGSDIMYNTFYGYLAYNPTDLVSANNQHAWFSGFQTNVKIKYNYTHGAGFSIVYKGGNSGVDHINVSGGCVAYNISVNGYVGIICRGAEAVPIYGNTLVNTLARLAYGIELIGSSNNTIIKNNILIDTSNNASSYLISADATSKTGNTSENNVIYTLNPYVAVLTPDAYDKAGWQGLGYDLLSKYLTAGQYANLFNAGLYTLKAGSEAIGAGETLDAAYDDGLDASTNWGSVSSLPVVVTKQQGAAWDIGAYVS